MTIRRADVAELRLLGWQAPYAAGRTTAEKRRNPLVKRHGYQHMFGRIASERQPILVALDGNNWGDSLEAASVISDAGNAWHDEHRFHGASPSHGLLDTLRVVVARDPERAAACAPGQPVAVTKVVPSGLHRMDRIYVSASVAVADAGVVYTDADGRPTHNPAADGRHLTAGSDHALVWARITLPAASS